MLENIFLLIAGAALIFALSIIVGQEHPVLKFVFIMIVINLLPVMALAGLDSQTTCAPVLNSTTANESSTNTTTYTYVDHCTRNESGAYTTFFKVSSRIVWGTYLYAMAYFLYWFFVLRLNKVLGIEGYRPRLKKK